MLKVLENLLRAWRRGVPVRPTVAERQEARKWPNGYIYRIDRQAPEIQGPDVRRSASISHSPEA
jgi:hypothetical protein